MADPDWKGKNGRNISSTARGIKGPGGGREWPRQLSPTSGDSAAQRKFGSKLADPRRADHSSSRGFPDRVLSCITTGRALSNALTPIHISTYPRHGLLFDLAEEHGVATSMCSAELGRVFCISPSPATGVPAVGKQAQSTMPEAVVARKVRLCRNQEATRVHDASCWTSRNVRHGARLSQAHGSGLSWKWA